MSGTIGSWGAGLAPPSPEVAALARAARDLIVQLHPGAVDVARPGDRAVSFGHGPAKMKEAYACLMPQSGWLNLGFYHGADLPDPAGQSAGGNRQGAAACKAARAARSVTGGRGAFTRGHCGPDAPVRALDTAPRPTNFLRKFRPDPRRRAGCEG